MILYIHTASYYRAAVQFALNDYKKQYDDFTEQHELLFRVAFSIELRLIVESDDDINLMSALEIFTDDAYEVLTRRIDKLGGWNDSNVYFLCMIVCIIVMSMNDFIDL